MPNRNMKQLIKDFVPPVVVKTIFPKKPDWGWFGRYKTWEEAKQQTQGYDASHILEKKKATFRQIKSGEAMYELDSIIYKKKSFNTPLLFSLSHIANKKIESLTLIDFGGSLGSSYYWVKDFINPHIQLDWNIIEQAHIVEAGKAEFETDSLHFYENFESFKAVKKADVLLLSGVIQCISDWQFIIDEIKESQPEYIIIDRTPFFKNPDTADSISVQLLNASVYGKPSSFPCWIFNQASIISEIKNDYEILIDCENFEHLNYDYEGGEFYFRFLFLKRKTNL